MMQMMMKQQADDNKKILEEFRNELSQVKKERDEYRETIQNIKVSKNEINIIEHDKDDKTLIKAENTSKHENNKNLPMDRMKYQQL